MAGTSKEQEWFLKAINSFGQRLMVISPEFEILASNHSPEGVPQEEIIGQRCFEVFYGRNAVCEQCGVKQAMDSGYPVFKTADALGSSGGRVPCYYCYPIHDRAGGLEAYVSVDFDVPAIQMVEEKLERSNAFLENLILSAGVSVIAADRDGRIFIFNNSAEKVFGYTREEAISSLNVRDIYEDGVAYQIMRMLRAEEPDGPDRLKSYKVDTVAKCGELIPISLYASIIYENGKEVATVGYFHDLRERIRLQKEMERTQLQVVQAEKMVSLGKLAAGVAHQLNNPLGGIILFTKLVLEEYELEDSAREDLARVVADAKRCRDTVKELLEFTRQTRHLMAPRNLNEAITRTMFLLESQVLFQNIEVTKELAEDLPLVRIDQQQINHLLMNIILNAAQAMDGQGKLLLRTSLVRSGRVARVEIADSGPGIPEQILGHIFDPFFTTKDEGEGTGLGLSLVYGIVKNHGGTICAKNRAGGGASFLIDLPVNNTPNGVDQRGDDT
ncbi:MAG: ATP-binding protein [bacterium]